MKKLRPLTMKQQLLLLSTTLFIVLMYLIGLVYFKSHFLPNTYVGKVNVAQLNPQEATQKVQEELDKTQVIFTKEGKELAYVELKQLNVAFDSTDALNKALKKQNSAIWPVTLFKVTQAQALDDVGMDGGALDALVSSLGIDNKDATATVNAHLEKDDQGHFKIVDEIYGNEITGQSIKETIVDSLKHSNNTVKLEEAYLKPSVTKDTPALHEQLDKVEKLTKAKITLVLNGQEHVIDEGDLGKWIDISSSGDVTVDHDKVDAYLDEINHTYASRFKVRSFDSTYSGPVEVQAGTYGWFIDREVEVPVLSQLVLEGKDVKHEPAIEGQAYGVENDIGDTYVEVDIAHQMMAIYKEGQLVLQTPVVTGRLGAETVPGAYVVWNKEENTNLTGYDPIHGRNYTQPVRYWIAFDNQAQGIHDASWQSSFGGTTYINSGSLGCVNTPPSVMGQVFELVDYGMPVIIF